MIRMLAGDCRDVLATLPSDSVHCVVTSPPYFGLRDYGVTGQIGLEPSPAEYVAELVAVFREVRRVLRPDGTLWLNLGDSYNGLKLGNTNGSGVSGLKRNVANEESRLRCLAENKIARSDSFRKPLFAGLKQKDLIGIPWMVAFALRDDGWYLRQDIIWSKPNPMPESITDRCTKAHEYLFLLSRSARYWFDADAIAEPANSFGRQHTSVKQPPKVQALKAAGMIRGAGGDLSVNYERAARNKRSVWTVASEPFAEAHFATFPPALIEPCILAGCPIGGTVLDPFAGAGTTGLVADRLQRDAVLIELNPAYCRMAQTRITDDAPLFAAVEAAE